MSREIKFRAWNPSLKEMSEVVTIDLRDNEITDIIKNKEGDVTSKGGSTGFELMQFTGLKDKNGKEIYEGDIVKTERLKEIDYIIRVQGVIKYSNIFGGFIIEWEEGVATFGNDFLPNHVKVIGNIYENPEMLKDAM